MKWSKAALPLWIVDHFKKEEAHEIFSERCTFCGRTFLEFLLAPASNCPACDKPFAALLTTFLDMTVKERKVKTSPAATGTEGKAVLTEREKSEPSNALRLLQMKERLEALLSDERYEEAALLKEQIKTLEIQLANDSARRN